MKDFSLNLEIFWEYRKRVKENFPGDFLGRKYKEISKLRNKISRKL